MLFYYAALEVLCVNIRYTNDIRGIKVDNEEIKVSLFADDLTVFLKDDLSLTNFLKLIEDYGTCSGLKVNHEKTEFRGTQRQFSENICSEYDLKSRIFGTLAVKFLACLSLLGFSNI